MAGNYKHGLTGTQLYKLWKSIMGRCYSLLEPGYERIQVCDEWRDNPVAFVQWAKDNGYAQGLQIDRIDNTGDYSPSNCHFVTPSENSNNTRANRKITAFGETKTVAQWARDDRVVVAYPTIYYRMVTGWDSERLLTTPARKKRPHQRAQAHDTNLEGVLLW